MFSSLLVVNGQNLFEPVCLSGSVFFVRQGGIVEYGKLLSTAVTAKSSHIPHFGRSFSCLPLLDRCRLHDRSQFYPPFRSATRRMGTQPGPSHSEAEVLTQLTDEFKDTALAAYAAGD